jgi:hypothetical protein
LESLAARTPDSDDIDRVLDYAVAILKQQFSAYTIDIMWEAGQGRHAHLVALKVDETERHGYDRRPVYRTDSNAPSSLTSWCYENDHPVWLIDHDGLRSDKQYRNLLRPGETIAPDTIFAYNKEVIRTEVCWPLQIEVKREVPKTAGVLNIESTHSINPTKEARGLVVAAARVIAQLITRRITAESARRGTAEAIKEMEKLMVNLHVEPTLHPAAFLALPMSMPGATQIAGWIRQVLQSRGNGIRLVSADNTVGRVTTTLDADVRRSNFAVVVSTTYNPNVMWEWGVVTGHGRPVVRLHQVHSADEKQPFDVADARAYYYAHPSEQLDEGKFKAVLNEALDVLETERTDLAALWEKRSSDLNAG